LEVGKLIHRKADNGKKLRQKGFKLSLTAGLTLMAVNLRYTFIVLLIKAVNFLISS
jgi:hypothetical protein